MIKKYNFSNSEDYHSFLVAILKFAVFCIFLGRAWQHLIWDAPLRTLLWDQNLMEGIITSLLGISWQEYANSSETDSLIQNCIQFTGAFYLICAITVLFVNKNRKWTGYFMWLGSLFLSFLAMLYWKEKFLQLGQLFEYTTQIVAPLLLYFLVFGGISTKFFILLSKIAISLTFICHGLYALGYYPQPGNYLDMVISILHLSESHASLLLVVAGILDVIIGIVIFIPALAPAALWYAFIWGTLTALARVVANFYIDMPWESLNQWSHESLYRFSHGLVPFILLIPYYFKLQKKEEAEVLPSIPRKKVSVAN